MLGRGETKASIEFSDGVRAQLWVHPPERFGTALQYATGSKDHNVKLRQIALDKGLSLSEHALTKVKGGGEILCATEEKVYETLGVQWVPPELREDRGEVEAAKAGKLPKLIQVKDIKSNLHMHSTFSDGALSILDMTQAAIKRGLKTIVFTDHSVGLGVANGLSMERHKEQAAEIKKVQKQVGDKILILHGSEVEIKADGSLDYPDDFLASLDLVVASLHSSLRQPAWRWRSTPIPRASILTMGLPAALVSWVCSSASTPMRTPKAIMTCCITASPLPAAHGSSRSMSSTRGRKRNYWIG